MAVFPELMNHLNPADPAASLSTVEQYISYMNQQLEFHMGNLSRSQGVQAVELLRQDLNTARSELSAAIGSARETLSTQTGTLTTQMTALQEQMTALNGQLAALADRVTALEPPVEDTTT